MKEGGRDVLDINARDHAGRLAVGAGMGSKPARRRQSRRVGPEDVWPEEQAERTALHAEVCKVIFQRADAEADGEELVAALHLGWEQIAVRCLHRPKTDPNSRDESGSPALLIAAKKGFINVLRVFLERGTLEIMATDPDGHTALHACSRLGLVDPIQSLLRRKADPTFQDSKGRTALHYAALYGQTDVVKILLSATGVEVAIRDNMGATCLRAAFQSTHIEVVHLLLDKTEMDPDRFENGGAAGTATLADLGGRTPLLWCLENNFQHLARRLVDKTTIELIDCKSADGSTALAHAISLQNAELVTALVKRPDAEVDCQDKKWGLTPLLYAAKHGLDEVCRLVLKHEDVAINARDADGRTALQHCGIQGWQGVVEDIVSRPDTDMNAADSEGLTALAVAIEANHTGVIRAILSASHLDVDVSVRTRTGETPLLWAVKNASADMPGGKDPPGRSKFDRTRSIVRGGAQDLCAKILGHELVDVEAKDGDGKTALHYAAERGYVMMCAKIIAQPRVNLEAVDNEGRTALSLGMDGGHVKVVELLVSREDCDISKARDVHGNTPMFWAATLHHVQAFQTMSEKMNINLNDRDGLGRTLLHIAAETGDAEICEVLLNRPDTELNMEDNPRGRGERGRTPLEAAVAHGNEKIVLMLLHRREDAVDSGVGPEMLVTACRNGWDSVIVALARREGVDATHKDGRGRPPLHCCAERGDRVGVDRLLAREDASQLLHQRDKDGRTALGQAMAREQRSVCATLVRAGAEVANSQDRHGATFLHWAAARDERLLKDALAATRPVSEDDDMQVPLVDVNQLNAEGSPALHLATPACRALLLQHACIKVDLADARGRTALAVASMTSDVAAVQDLLAHNADPTRADHEGWTPLHHSCAVGAGEIVREFLWSGGAQWDAETQDGLQPLHLAARAGDAVTVEAILECYDFKARRTDLEKVDGRDPSGRTPLTIAAARGDLRVCRMFLEASADPEVRDADGQCALHWLAGNGLDDALLIALDTGAGRSKAGWRKTDPNTSDIQGHTPLHFAALGGHCSAVEKLLGSGADAAAADTDGATPLLLAGEKGHRDVFRILCAASAELVGRHGPTGRHGPLHWCAIRGWEDCAVEILKLQADVHAADEDGRCPLHHAAQNGFFEVVEILLERQADPSQLDAQGRSALGLAAQYSHWVVAERLAGHGAPQCAQGQDGRSPLHWAARHGGEGLLRSLVPQIPESVLNARDKEGMTPLRLAVAYDHVGCVRVLTAREETDCISDLRGTSCLLLAAARGLEHVCLAILERPDLVLGRDKHGTTALHLACSEGLEEVAKRLLERRAAPGADDEDGTTPLHAACSQGLPSVVERMLEMDADCGMQDSNGRTPLLCAAEANGAAVCTLLLEPVVLPPIAVGHESISCSRVSPGDLHKSLRVAAHCGYGMVVASLLRDADPGHIAAALVVALERGHVHACVAILSKAPPQLSHYPPSMLLPVHAAANLGMEAAARLMLTGPDLTPGALDDFGRNALHYAAKSGLADVCRDLVYHPDLDSTAYDDGGQTARQLALKGGHHAVVEILPQDISEFAAVRPSAQMQLLQERTMHSYSPDGGQTRWPGKPRVKGPVKRSFLRRWTGQE